MAREREGTGCVVPIEAPQKRDTAKMAAAAGSIKRVRTNRRPPARVWLWLAAAHQPGMADAQSEAAAKAAFEAEGAAPGSPRQAKTILTISPVAREGSPRCISRLMVFVRRARTTFTTPRNDTRTYQPIRVDEKRPNGTRPIRVHEKRQNGVRPPRPMTDARLASS